MNDDNEEEENLESLIRLLQGIFSGLPSLISDYLRNPRTNLKDAINSLVHDAGATFERILNTPPGVRAQQFRDIDDLLRQADYLVRFLDKLPGGRSHDPNNWIIPSFDVLLKEADRRLEYCAKSYDELETEWKRKSAEVYILGTNEEYLNTRAALEVTRDLTIDYEAQKERLEKEKLRIDKQKKKIEKEKKEFEGKKEFYAELKKEHSLNVKMYKDLKNEQESCRNQKKLCFSELTKAKTTIAELQGKLDTITRVGETTAKVVGDQEKMITEEVEQLEKETHDNDEVLEALRSEIEQLKNDKIKLESTIASLEEQLNEPLIYTEDWDDYGTINQVEEPMAIEGNPEDQRTPEIVAAELQKLKDRLAEYKETNTKLLTRLGNLESQLETINAKKDDDVERLEKEIETLKEEHEKAIKDLLEVKEIEKQQQEGGNEPLQMDADVSEQKAAGETVDRRYTSRLDELNDKYKRVLDERNTAREELRTFKSLNLSDELKKCSNNLMNRQRELDEAIKREGAHTAEIERLRLLIPSYEPLPAATSEDWQQIKKKVEDDLWLYKRNYEQTIRSLRIFIDRYKDEDKFSTDQLVNAQLEAVLGLLLGRDKTIESLTKQLQKATENAKEKENRLLRIEPEAESLRKTNEENLRLIATARTEIEQLQTQTQGLNQGIGVSTEAIVKDQQLANTQKAEAEKKLKEIEEKLKEIEQEKERQARELEDVKQQLVNKQDELLQKRTDEEWTTLEEAKIALTTQMQEMQTQVVAATTARQAAETDLADKTRALVEINKKLEDALRNKDDIQIQLAAANERNQALTERLTKLRGPSLKIKEARTKGQGKAKEARDEERARAKDDEDELNRRGRLINELIDNAGNISSLQMTLAEARSSIMALEADKTTLINAAKETATKVQGILEELTENKKTIVHLEAIVAGHVTKAAEYENQLKKLRELNESLQTQVDASEKKLSEQRSHVTDYDDISRQLAESKDKMETMSEANNKDKETISGLQKQVADLQQQLAEQLVETEKSNSEIKKLTSRITANETTIKKQEDELQEAREYFTLDQSARDLQVVSIRDQITLFSEQEQDRKATLAARDEEINQLTYDMRLKDFRIEELAAQHAGLRQQIQEIQQKNRELEKNLQSNASYKQSYDDLVKSQNDFKVRIFDDSVKNQEKLFISLLDTVNLPDEGTLGKNIASLRQYLIDSRERSHKLLVQLLKFIGKEPKDLTIKEIPDDLAEEIADMDDVMVDEDDITDANEPGNEQDDQYFANKLALRAARKEELKKLPEIESYNKAALEVYLKDLMDKPKELQNQLLGAAGLTATGDIEKDNKSLLKSIKESKDKVILGILSDLNLQPGSDTDGHIKALNDYVQKLGRQPNELLVDILTDLNVVISDDFTTNRRSLDRFISDQPNSVIKKILRDVNVEEASTFEDNLKVLYRYIEDLRNKPNMLISAMLEDLELTVHTDPKENLIELQNHIAMLIDKPNVSLNEHIKKILVDADIKPGSSLQGNTLLFNNYLKTLANQPNLMLMNILEQLKQPIVRDNVERNLKTLEEYIGSLIDRNTLLVTVLCNRGVTNPETLARDGQALEAYLNTLANKSLLLEVLKSRRVTNPEEIASDSYKIHEYLNHLANKPNERLIKVLQNLGVPNADRLASDPVALESYLREIPIRAKHERDIALLRLADRKIHETAEDNAQEIERYLTASRNLLAANQRLADEIGKYRKDVRFQVEVGALERMQRKIADVVKIINSEQFVSRHSKQELVNELRDALTNPTFTTNLPEINVSKRKLIDRDFISIPRDITSSIPGDVGRTERRTASRRNAGTGVNVGADTGDFVVDQNVAAGFDPTASVVGQPTTFGVDDDDYDP